MTMPQTMPQTAPTQDQHEQPLDDTTQRGLTIYETRLKALLEPAHNDEVVAIHLDSGEYAVADSSPEALRAIRRTHPVGSLFLCTIGPSSDYGLARRMSGLGMGTGRK